MRVVIQVAAQLEWSSLLTLLGNPATAQHGLGGQYFTLHRGTTEIVAVHGGIGKVHAAATAQYAIMKWDPALVAVIGTSGAVSPDLKPLDIVAADRTIIYDIESGLDGNSDHEIQLHTTALELPALPDIPEFPLRIGTVLTGDRDVTKQNIESLRSRFDGLVADWESGAVARVCKLNKLKCMVLRGVSDSPHLSGTSQHDHYIQNTPIIMARLWQLLTEALLGHG